MKIGFFDSGIGGLSVLHTAMHLYPDAHYLYFADTDNVPYGTKKKKEIVSLVNDAADFLIKKKKVDLLVVACNTATSVCINQLRALYDIPIVGMEPAVKQAALKTNHKKQNNQILVSATKTTLKQKKLKDLIDNLKTTDKVKRISLQKLVRFAEAHDFDSKKVHKYLQRKLAKYDLNNFGALVLGCTHFIYYKDIIRLYLPSHIQIVDGNLGTVNRMLYYIDQLTPSEKTNSKLSFYQSKQRVSQEKFQPFLDFLNRMS